MSKLWPAASIHLSILFLYILCYFGFSVHASPTPPEPLLHPSIPRTSSAPASLSPPPPSAQDAVHVTHLLLWVGIAVGARATYHGPYRRRKRISLLQQASPAKKLLSWGGGGVFINSLTLHAWVLAGLAVCRQP